MSQYSLNSMMNELEKKIQPREKSIYSDNRMIDRITGDLEFFKEREYKSKEFSNNYSNFIDSRNPNFNPSSNYFPSSTTAGMGLNYNTPTLQTEKEIRKIIEREIEPFIFSAKNDLRLNIEAFSREIADYKHFEGELRSVKEIVQENKRLVLVNQEENERKMNDNIYKFKTVIKQFDNIKECIADFTKKIKNFEKIYDEIHDKFYIMDDLKQKLSQYENMTEKIFQQMDENFSDKFSNKIKNLEVNMENAKSQLIENGINLNNISYEFKNINKETADLKIKEKDSSSLIKELKEKLNYFNSNTDGRFDELNKNFSNQLETLKINIKNINEDIEQIKYNGLNSNSNRNGNQNEKVDSINSNMIEIKLKLDKINNRCNHYDIQFDESFSNLRTYRIEIDELNKNIKLNEMEIKEYEEKFNRKFPNKTEVERELSEIKNQVTQKFLILKDENFKSLNDGINSVKSDCQKKIEVLEKELYKLKENFINLKNCDIKEKDNKGSSTEFLNFANIDNPVEIQNVKSQISDLKYTINSIKEENSRYKHEIENIKDENKESLQKQKSFYDLLEKTSEEILNKYVDIEMKVNSLNTFKDKNHDHMSKIHESFKKMRDKIQSLEDSQNILTDGLQDILSGQEDLKIKIEIIENSQNKESKQDLENLLNNEKTEDLLNQRNKKVDEKINKLNTDLSKIIEELEQNIDNKIKKLKETIESNKEEPDNLRKKNLNELNEIEIKLKEEILKVEKLIQDKNNSNIIEIINKDLLKLKNENKILNEEIVEIKNELSNFEENLKNSDKILLKELDEKIQQINYKFENQKFVIDNKEQNNNKTESLIIEKELIEKIEKIQTEFEEMKEKNLIKKKQKENNPNLDVKSEHLEEILLKIDNLETKIRIENENITEIKKESSLNLQIIRELFEEKLINNYEKYGKLFNYFEHKSNEIIENHEKRIEDLSDSIKMILNKLDELGVNNKSNHEELNKSNKIKNVEWKNDSKSLINLDNNTNDFFTTNHRILNLTSIEKDEYFEIETNIKSCSVTNLNEKYKLKGGESQKIDFFHDNNKQKNLKPFNEMNYEKDIKEMIYCSKKISENFFNFNNYQKTEFKIIPSKKFLKNSEYLKLNPIEFIVRKDEFVDYMNKYVCESNRYLNHLEVEIKTCDTNLNDEERMNFLNKRKENLLDDEENLQPFEKSIEDLKIDDSFSDF